MEPIQLVGRLIESRLESVRISDHEHGKYQRLTRVNGPVKSVTNEKLADVSVDGETDGFESGFWAWEMGAAVTASYSGCTDLCGYGKFAAWTDCTEYCCLPLLA